MQKHVDIVITGSVHGVGYRYAAWKKARELKLSGWVRNEPDGSVRAVAEGTPEKVAAFIDWCRQGSMLARVKKVDVLTGDIEGYQSFEIRR
jgi:acylphosphatase